MAATKKAYYSQLSLFSRSIDRMLASTSTLGQQQRDPVIPQCGRHFPIIAAVTHLAATLLLGREEKCQIIYQCFSLKSLGSALIKPVMSNETTWFTRSQNNKRKLLRPQHPFISFDGMQFGKTELKNGWKASLMVLNSKLCEEKCEQ